MDIGAEIGAAASDPEQLEQLYQAARRRKQVDAFRSALLAHYKQDPDNVLLAAWYYRLTAQTDDVAPRSRSANWLVAIPISVVTGLIFWGLSDVERLVVLDRVPQLLLWWSPIGTVGALIYMAITAKKRYGEAAALGLGVLAAASYARLLSPAFGPDWGTKQYLILAAIHIPLLCWVAQGVWALGTRSSTADRFAFLIKSIEVGIVAGLYLAAGMAFGGMTVGMFAALGIELPEVVMRLIAAGGFGLLPVLTVTTIQA